MVANFFVLLLLGGCGRDKLGLSESSILCLVVVWRLWLGQAGLVLIPSSIFSLGGRQAVIVLSLSLLLGLGKRVVERDHLVVSSLSDLIVL